MAEQTIICPNCGKRIPISKALTHQIEADLEKGYQALIAKKEKEAREKYKKKLAAEATRMKVEARKKAVAAASIEMTRIKSELLKAQRESKTVKAQFDERIQIERSRLERLAKKNADAEVTDKLASLQKQLTDKNKKIAETKKQKEEITEQLENEFRRRELQLNRKINVAKLQAADLKRRLEQSSQQTQGDVVEVELHELLMKSFPEDKIKPIGVGKRGADVLQKVYSPSGSFCGAILWESKDTQKWSKTWLTKLRTDQRREKAELAVLVSVVLPNGIKHFSQIDGIWVAKLPLVLGLAIALRSNLIDVAVLRQTSQGGHEKMELLFDYLSGTEFRHRIEAMVEAFGTMQEDLQKERQVMERHWAKREKQLQLFAQNISGMYGDMQGIVGQSLPKIKRLELPPPSK